MSTKSFQLTNLLFLMRSICVSLGFNESQEFSKQQEHTVADLEQMRAFTGVYYLVVSSVSSHSVSFSSTLAIYWDLHGFSNRYYGAQEHSL